jgi:hypothetical protein
VVERLIFLPLISSTRNTNQRLTWMLATHRDVARSPGYHREHTDLPRSGAFSGFAARGGRRRPWAWPDSNGAVILGFSDAQYQRWALSRLTTTVRENERSSRDPRLAMSGHAVRTPG